MQWACDLCPFCMSDRQNSEAINAWIKLLTILLRRWPWNILGKDEMVCTCVLVKCNNMSTLTVFLSASLCISTSAHAYLLRTARGAHAYAYMRVLDDQCARIWKVVYFMRALADAYIEALRPRPKPRYSVVFARAHSCVFKKRICHIPEKKLLVLSQNAIHEMLVL